MTDVTSPETDGLPDWVWDIHPNLAHVRDAALSRETDPAALLATCLVRLNVLGGPGLLIDIGKGPVTGSGYVAIVSPPGGGKSQVFNAVDDLLPVPEALVKTPFDLEAGIMTLGQTRGDTGYIRAVPNNGSALMKMLCVQAVDDDALPEAGADVITVTVPIRRAEVFTPEGDQVLKLIDVGETKSGQAVPLETSLLLGFLSEEMSNFTSGKEFRARIEGLGYTLGVSLGCQDVVAAQLLGKKGKGLAQRFLYFVLPPRNAPDDLMDVAEDLLAGKLVDEETARAILAQLGNAPEFPGSLDHVVTHAIRMSRRPDAILPLEEVVRLNLRLLGVAVGASNGLSQDDDYVVHLVLQRLFVMKGLMLLMEQDFLSDTCWNIASEMDRLSSRSLKLLAEQGESEVASRRAGDRREKAEDKTRLDTLITRKPEDLKAETLRNVGIALSLQVRRVIKESGKDSVSLEDVVRSVVKDSVASWIECTGAQGTYSVVRRSLAREALEWAAEDGKLSRTGVGKRVKYRAPVK